MPPPSNLIPASASPASKVDTTLTTFLLAVYIFMSEEEEAMWRKNASLFLSMTLASVLLCPHCATFMEQRTQRIPVTSSPAGATISVNSRPQGVTPLEIGLERKVKDQVIRIEAAGYHPFEIRVKRGISAGKLIMDVVLGAAAGLAAALLYEGITNDEGYTVLAIGIPAGIVGFPLIDAASGRIYTLNPTELIVTLTKADGPPRVDRIFVDADDLQNIKWIRIRRD